MPRRKVDIPLLLLCVLVFAGMIWVCFFAKGELGETLRTLLFFALAVWSIISGIWQLVQWFRNWHRMTPEQRLAFKESRRWRGFGKARSR